MFFSLFYLHAAQEEKEKHGTYVGGTNAVNYTVLHKYNLPFLATNSICLFVPYEDHMFSRIFLSGLAKYGTSGFDVYIVLANKKISIQAFDGQKRVAKYRNIRDSSMIMQCILQITSNGLTTIRKQNLFHISLDNFDISIIATDENYKQACVIAKTSSDIYGFVQVIVASHEIFDKIGNFSMYLYKRNNGEYLGFNGNVPEFFDLNKTLIPEVSLSELLSPKKATFFCITRNYTDANRRVMTNFSYKYTELVIPYIPRSTMRELELLFEFEEKGAEFIYIKQSTNKKTVYSFFSETFDEQDINKFIEESLNETSTNAYFSENIKRQTLSPLVQLSGKTYVDFITNNRTIPVVLYVSSMNQCEEAIEAMWKSAIRVRDSRKKYSFGYINIDLNNCVEKFPCTAKDTPTILVNTKDGKNYIKYLSDTSSTKCIDDFVHNSVPEILQQENFSIPSQISNAQLVDIDNIYPQEVQHSYGTGEISVDGYLDELLDNVYDAFYSFEGESTVSTDSMEIDYDEEEEESM